MKLGSTTINKLMLGSTECKKAYLGSTLVYDKTGGEEVRTPPSFINTYDPTEWTSASQENWALKADANAGNAYDAPLVAGDIVVSLSGQDWDIDIPPEVFLVGEEEYTDIQQILTQSGYVTIGARLLPVADTGDADFYGYNEIGSNHSYGYQVFQFRDSDGIGASDKKTDTGAPSIDITTTQDNSAIIVFVADANNVDGSSRVWRTVNGFTPTAGNEAERTYYDGEWWNVYTAYYPDAGPAGLKTVGLSAPSGQKYSIIAVEILGTET